MDTSIFYDIVKDIDDSIKFIVVIGGRGIGKTYSSLSYLLKRENPIYLRNTQDEIDLSCTAEGNPFKKYNKDKSLSYSFEKQGRFYHLMDYTITEEPKPIGLGLNLSTIYKVRGMDFSDTDFILWDEFIPDESQALRFNEGKAFLNFYETVARNREYFGEKPVQVVMLSNANNFNSRALSELDVLDELERMLRNGIRRMTLPKRGIRLVMPKMEEFEEVKSQMALYGALTESSSFKEMALRNGFTNISFQNVKKVKLMEYIPLCSYEGLYIYKHKSRLQYYVCRSRADCESYSALDTKILFIRRWYCFRDEMLDGTFLYSDYNVKHQFLSLFFK